MYVKTIQRARGGQKRLGDIPSWLYWIDPLWVAAGNKVVTAAPSTDSNFSVLDSLKNVFSNATGTPLTANQAAQSTSDCVANIQRMRQLYPANVPAGAEAQCAGDQSAYLSLSQTVDTPPAFGVPWWLWAIAGGAVLYGISR